MSGSEEWPQPLRGFDESKARKLYLRTVLSGGVLIGLLLIMSYFSASIRSPVLVDVGLGLLVLLILSFAYFLPRAIRIYMRSLKFRRKN